jgi:hypothetical protein
LGKGLAGKSATQRSAEIIAGGLPRAFVKSELFWVIQALSAFRRKRI